MSDEDEYLGRGFDHIETIARTLQNLRGEAALAHELIQNADDAEGALHLTFRFTHEALEVIDDGGFESCGRLGERRCPWEAERKRHKGKKRCDFHAFRQLAGASKDSAPDLTGAFGVGFLSVYQITDRPELFSAGQHWIINEDEQEKRRIRCCRADCGHQHISEGTRFRLPWAARPSPMRELLASPPAPPATQERLWRAFKKSVPAAMVFLHNLKSITLQRGDEKLRFGCDRVHDGVHIHGAGVDDRWLILSGDFDETANKLREKYEPIGERKASVRVAVLPRRFASGRVYATLPTQFATGMPLHVDAAFYPKLDRKGIIVDGDGREAEWNRAAIEAASELVATNLEAVAQALDPKPFWELIRDTQHNHGRKHRGVDDSFGVFWSAIERELPAAEVMWTSSGRWAAVCDTVLPGAKEPPELPDLLEALGIQVVAEELRPTIAAMARSVPTATLGMDRLLDGLESAGLQHGPFAAADLPAGLGDRKRRNLARRLLAQYLEEDQHKDRIRELALWHTSDRTYNSLKASYLVERQTAAVFGHVIGCPLIDADAQDPLLAPLQRTLGDCWKVEQALDALRTNAEARPTNASEASGVLAWLDTHRAQITADHFASLSTIPLIPTSAGIHPAQECVIPGGFADPLDIAGEVDADVATRFGSLLSELGVKPLSFADYVPRFLPTAVARGVTTSKALEFLDICVAQRQTIDGNASVRQVLSRTAWTPCADGQLRRPDQVYFDRPIVRDVLGDSAPKIAAAVRPSSGRAGLLRDLGAQESPRPADVVAHVLHVTKTPPDVASIAAIRRVLHHLNDSLADVSDTGPYAGLHDHAWLPQADAATWAQPKLLYFHKLRSLFATTGRFIDLPTTEQETLRRILGADGLGVGQKPPVALVVGHVRNLAAAQEPVSDTIWKFLDENAPEPSLGQLAQTSCWPTEDGATVSAIGLFRLGHKLTPYRAVLASRLRGLAKLLAEVGIAPSPAAQDASDVLLEISKDAAEPLPRAAAQVVKECWRLLSDLDGDVDDLAGHDVALGGDGFLYDPVDLLFNDNKPIAERFDEGTRKRLIAKGDAWQALERAGIEALSARLRSTLVRHGDPLEDDYVAARIHERQRHLARIAAGERGSWERVLGFARELKVETFEWLEIQHHIEDFNSPPTEPERAAAHYLAHQSRLVVARPEKRTEWREVARCLREPLLPAESSPAVNRVIADALRVDSVAQADRELDDVPYPAIDTDEFEAIVTERNRRLREGSEDALVEALAVDDLDADNSQPDDIDAGKSSAQIDAEALPPEGLDSDPDESGLVHDDSGPDDRSSGNADATSEESRPRRQRPSADASSDKTANARQVGRASGGRATGQRRHRTGAATNASAKVAAELSSNGTGNRTSSATGGGGQLVSYVEPKSKEDRAEHDQAARDAIGDAGVDLVCAALQKQHGAAMRVVKMEDRQKGYDIEVRQLDHTLHELVEVKTKKGPWDLRGVWVSRAQFDSALNPKPAKAFVLAVVEHVYETEATIHFLVDPARRIDKFCFDHGWAEAADRRLVVPGAIARQSVVPDERPDGGLGGLIEAVLAVGLPAPARPWQLNGTQLLAAWPDNCIGISSEMFADARFADWVIRRVEDWTSESLIDTLRRGR